MEPALPSAKIDDLKEILSNCSKDLEVICQNEEKYLSVLHQAQKNIKSKDLTMIFLGEVSAGKTTAINHFLSFDEKQNKFVKENFGILPANRNENTGFIWIIQKSPDEKFRIFYEGKEEEFGQIIKRMKALDDEQREYILSIKIAQKISDLKEVRIEIPFMMENIKIIDFPGISSEIISNKLMEMVKSEFAFFIYVKNVISKEAISSDILTFFQKLIQDLKSSVAADSILDERFNRNLKVFSILFTHKDKILDIDEEIKEEYENMDEMKKGRYEIALRRINGNLSEMSFLNVRDMFVFDFVAMGNKKPKATQEIIFFQQQEKEQGIYRRFIHSIVHFKNLYNEIFMSCKFAHTMEIIFETFIKDEQEKSSKMDKSSKIAIEKLGDAGKLFETKIREFYDSILSIDTFVQSQRILYDNILKIIEEELKKHSYKEQSLEEISNKIFENTFDKINEKIEEKAMEIKKTNVERFLSELSQSKETKDLLNSLKIDVNTFDSIDQISKTKNLLLSNMSLLTNNALLSSFVQILLPFLLKNENPKSPKEIVDEVLHKLVGALIFGKESWISNQILAQRAFRIFGKQHFAGKDCRCIQ